MPNPGMSPEIVEAMQRRGMGMPSPQIGQVSPEAATVNPVPQPASPSSLNKSSAPPGSSTTKEKFQPQTQEDMIVMSLIEQLKNSNKAKKEQTALAMGGGAPMMMPRVEQTQQSPGFFSMNTPNTRSMAITPRQGNNLF